MVAPTLPKESGGVIGSGSTFKAMKQHCLGELKACLKDLVYSLKHPDCLKEKT
jgi:hypothetical protein